MERRHKRIRMAVDINKEEVKALKHLKDQILFPDYLEIYFDKVKGRGIKSKINFRPGEFILFYGGILTEEEPICSDDYYFQLPKLSGKQYYIDATKQDTGFGRLLNDNDRSPNLVVKPIRYKGISWPVFFARTVINIGDPLEYSYGGPPSYYWWRKRKRKVTKRKEKFKKLKEAGSPSKGKNESDVKMVVNECSIDQNQPSPSTLLPVRRQISTSLEKGKEDTLLIESEKQKSTEDDILKLKENMEELKRNLNKLEESNQTALSRLENKFTTNLNTGLQSLQNVWGEKIDVALKEGQKDRKLLLKFIQASTNKHISHESRYRQESVEMSSPSIQNRVSSESSDTIFSQKSVVDLAINGNNKSIPIEEEVSPEMLNSSVPPICQGFDIEDNKEEYVEISPPLIQNQVSSKSSHTFSSQKSKVILAIDNNDEAIPNRLITRGEVLHQISTSSVPLICQGYDIKDTREDSNDTKVNKVGFTTTLYYLYPPSNIITAANINYRWKNK